MLIDGHDEASPRPLATTIAAPRVRRETLLKVHVRRQEKCGRDLRDRRLVEERVLALRAGRLNAGRRGSDVIAKDRLAVTRGVAQPVGDLGKTNRAGVVKRAVGQLRL